MEQLSIILLGALQGVTEFLPISSSGHLVIARDLLQLASPGILVEVVLHLGTLVSILIYFRRDLRQLLVGFFLAGEQGAASRREVALLAVATLPAVAAALTLADPVEDAFQNVTFTGGLLLVTALVLLSTRWVRVGATGRLSWRAAILVGAAQAAALFPGISRSGITIAAGLWLGLEPRQAARFSFLMAIPALLGAGLFELVKLLGNSLPSVPGLLLGFLTAAGVGYFMLGWFIQVLQRGKFHLFAGYTLLVGLVIIF